MYDSENYFEVNHKSSSMKYILSCNCTKPSTKKNVKRSENKENNTPSLL